MENTNPTPENQGSQMGQSSEAPHQAPHEEPKMAMPAGGFDAKDIEENKLVAALSYVGILVFVPLILKKDSKYAYEHAKQGLMVFIAGLIGSFIFWIPVIGWILAVALFVLDIIALIKCLQGEFWEIPGVGPLRNKFNL
ncbi:MAG: DUF4870 domain-containing protein [Patescibacteria group bacterium]